MHKSSSEQQISVVKEFLVFTSAEGDISVNARIIDETIWLTQKLMAQLYGVTIPTINEHLKNIYLEQELNHEATIRKFLIVQKEGGREVARDVEHYNLDAIISVGYRVNSHRATQFRIWATERLHSYIIKGFMLDQQRLKNGPLFGQDYFAELLEQIREIRVSERRFYQKITDLYATAVDYNVQDKLTKEFFATVQNKLHYAIHGHTAAELIKARANSEVSYMGLTTWKNAPKGKILKTDVSIAKNYLNRDEIGAFERFVKDAIHKGQMRVLPAATALERTRKIIALASNLASDFRRVRDQ
ncbi:MAG: DUF3375 family protein [Gammaproteobacteria bacterium]|nr:DUF3375 family protein [Gammaproteobacteria bacterium]